MENRRSFIRTAALSTLGTILLIDPFLKSCSRISDKTVAEIAGQFSHFCEIVRPDDFLYLRYYFVNLSLKGKRLSKIHKELDGYIIVRIPQQHIGEEVQKSISPKTATADWSFDSNCKIKFPDEATKNYSRSFISGFSYLTLKLKGKQNSVKYNFESLTNWNEFDLISLEDLKKYPQDIPVNLLIDKNQYPISENNFPAELAVANINGLYIPITLIEAPYKLLLTPVVPQIRPGRDTKYRYQFSNDNSINTYYVSKDQKQQLSELWSSNLFLEGVSAEKGISRIPPNFKIVAYEENSNLSAEDNNVFLLPNPSDKSDVAYPLLAQNQRSKLASLTNISGYNRDIYSDYFNISSLGVSTNLHYENLEPLDKEIVKWNQEIKLGRDNDVEITVRAIDSRSGLKVLVSNIAERRIEKGKSVLIYREKFEYLDPFKEFNDPQLFNGHLIKKITPLSKGAFFVSDPVKDDGVIVLDECSKLLIKMPYECITISGVRYTWEIDLYIIKEKIFKNPQAVKDSLNEFNKKISGFYTNPKTYQFDHSIRVKNEKIAFAPAIEDLAEDNSSENANTQLFTSEIQLYSIYGGNYDSEHPLLPRLKYARVLIPQLDGIETVPKQRMVNYCQSFIKYGFSELNRTKVFLQTLKDDFESFIIDKETDQLIIEDFKTKALNPITNVFTENYKNAGSLINPDIVIDNISALKQGITFTDELNDRVEDIKNINPADILRGLNVEILGGINLKKILKNIIPIADSPVFNIIEEAREGFTMYKQEYENLKNQIQSIPGEIKALENQVKDIFNSEIKTYLDKYYQAKEKLTQLSDMRNIELEIDTVTHKKKKIFEIIRENEKTLEDNLLEKVKSSKLYTAYLEPVIKNVTDFLTKADEDLKTLIALKQITDAIEARIEDVTNKIRSKQLMAGVPELEALTNLLNDTKKAILVNGSVKTATTNIKAFYQNVLSTKKDIETLIARCPGFAPALIKEIFKKYLFYKPANGDNSTLRKGKIYDVQDILAKFYRDTSYNFGTDFIFSPDKTFTLQDNIDSLIEVFNENKTELVAYSDYYYTCFIDAYNDVISTSDKFLEIQQRRIAKDLDLLSNQVKHEVRQELDKVWDTVVIKSEAFRKLKETYFFYQTIYLEFAEIQKRASAFENQLGIDLSEFKNNYSKLLPALEKQMKLKLEEQLKSMADDSRLVEIKNQIEGVKAKVQELVFEKADEYINLFNSVEKEITKQTDILYNRFDGERQKILKAIVDKKTQLKSYENQMKHFLKSKLQEIETNLRNSNQELIDAYQKGADSVTEAKKNIQKYQDLLNKLRAINKKEVSYTWTTDKFDDVNLGILKFIKGKQTPTVLSVDVKSTINFSIESFPPRISSITTATKTKLSNFSVSFLSILSVEFENVSFIAGSGVEEKFDVAIRDVRFEGPLNFVQVFQKYLKTIDKGLRFDISAAGAVLGYEVCLPDITGGAFNFVNWKLVMELNLPFKAGVPMRIYVGLNTQQDMGLVTGAIWGGRGCLVIGLEPKRGIVYILLIIEVGVVLYLNIGVAEGIVYIFAGIYIKKEYDKVELRGYLTCGGALNILGLITASVTFYMGLRSNGNYVDGYCTITYEIEICAFVKISVSMSMYKRIAGSPDNSRRSDANGQAPLNWLSETFSDVSVDNSANMDIDDNKIKITEGEWNDFFAAYYN